MSAFVRSDGGKLRKNSIETVGILAQIRNEHLIKANLDLYHYTSLSQKEVAEKQDFGLFTRISHNKLKLSLCLTN
jgi:hypothetical protein